MAKIAIGAAMALMVGAGIGVLLRPEYVDHAGDAGPRQEFHAAVHPAALAASNLARTSSGLILVATPQPAAQDFVVSHKVSWRPRTAAVGHDRRMSAGDADLSGRSDQTFAASEQSLPADWDADAPTQPTRTDPASDDPGAGD